MIKAKKILENSLKLFEEDRPKVAEYIRQEYIQDESGTATICISIPDAYQVFNPLTSGIQLSLDSTITDTIEQKAKAVPKLIPLKIKISGNCDLEAVQQALKEHFYIMLKEKQRAMTSNMLRSVSLFIFGSLFLALYLLMVHLNFFEMYNEIVSIIGTFALWEAVDSFVLIRADLRREYLKTGQLATAEIVLSRNQA